MSATTSGNEERRCQLLKECADDPHYLRLIQFFGRFPNARFSRLAIIHALNDGKIPVEKALKKLADKEILNVTYLNKVVLYCLTQEEPARRLVLDLAQLDRSQWQHLIQYTHYTNSLASTLNI